MKKRFNLMNRFLVVFWLIVFPKYRRIESFEIPELMFSTGDERYNEPYRQDKSLDDSLSNS